MIVVVYISLMLFFFSVAYSCFVCVKILTEKRDKENPEEDERRCREAKKRMLNDFKKRILNYALDYDIANGLTPKDEISAYHWFYKKYTDEELDAMDNYVLKELYTPDELFKITLIENMDEKENEPSRLDICLAYRDEIGKVYGYE